jgi:hypothetical protein
MHDGASGTNKEQVESPQKRTAWQNMEGARKTLRFCLIAENHWTQAHISNGLEKVCYAPAAAAFAFSLAFLLVPGGGSNSCMALIINKLLKTIDAHACEKAEYAVLEYATSTRGFEKKSGHSQSIRYPGV